MGRSVIDQDTEDMKDNTITAGLAATPDAILGTHSLLVPSQIEAFITGVCHSLSVCDTNWYSHTAIWWTCWNFTTHD